MQAWDNFYGPNAGYVLELYDRYRKDPNSIDPATRAFFEHWSPPADVTAATMAGTSAADIHKVNRRTNYPDPNHQYFHLFAQLDYLGMQPPLDPHLNP